MPTINKELLPMKAHYFLYNGGTAPIVPFMPTYAKQLGISPVLVGTIYAFLPISGMLAKPFFGAIADRFHIQKYLFLFFQVLTVVAFFSIHFIPEMPVENKIRFQCGDGDTFIDTCADNQTLKHKCAAAKVISETGHNSTLYCDMSCNLPQDKMWDTVCKYWNVTEYCTGNRPPDNVLNFKAVIPMDKTFQDDRCLYFEIKRLYFNDGEFIFPYCPTIKNGLSPKDVRHITAECFIDCESDVVNELMVASQDVTGSYQFWLFFMFLILSWVGMAVVVSIGDAICFEMLGDKPNLFGNQRMFGSIGWGVFSVLAGILVDYFSDGALKKNYASIFYLMLILLVFDVFVSFRLKYTQTKLSVSILRDVGRLVSELHILIFLGACIFIGLCTGLLWQFLFWYLEDLATDQECSMMNHIKTLEGLVMGIQCFGGELPFFFLSGWVLKKIGHINAISLVLLGFGVRFILYSVLTNPWWVLPIELLNGVTYGIFYATMASYASIAAPPGTEATVQGLVGAIFEGVGVSLGSLFGSMLYNWLGGALTFRIYGIAALIMCLAHVALQNVLKRKLNYSVTESEVFDSAARYATPGDAMQMIDDD